MRPQIADGALAFLPNTSPTLRLAASIPPTSPPWPSARLRLFISCVDALARQKRNALAISLIARAALPESVRCFSRASSSSSARPAGDGWPDVGSDH